MVETVKISSKHPVQPINLRALNDSENIWEGCVTLPIIGDTFCVALNYDPNFPTQIQVCASFDGSQGCFTVDIMDYACIPFGIEDLLDVQICFDNWNVTSDSVCFNIALQACAFFCVTLLSVGPICIPTAALKKRADKQLSATESKKLGAMLALQRKLPGSGPFAKASGCSCGG